MNLLQTRKGRLAAFSGLYLSEGLPQGFAGIALTLEFKRMGMDAAAIGAFAGTILLPWSWKFLVGPLVDNLKLRRFGARKQWIVAAQVGMLISLCAALLCMPRFTEAGMVGLGLFTGLLILHNVFAATQDVAIDALACSILKEDERGVANGIMFGSAQAGQAIGGSGVLALKEATGSFGWAALLVPLLLTSIIVGVLTLVREKPEEEPEAFGPGETAWSRAKDQILNYLRIAGKTIFCSKNGILGFLLAILPMGGMALSMVVSTILTPSLGMEDGEIAKLTLVCTLVWVPACLSGGWISDKLGRRITLAVSCTLSVLPGLWIGWQLKQAGWDHPPEGVDGVWPREDGLIRLWWIASLVFSAFHGLLYGVKTALFMDIINPRIAGTHFTALMAMANLVITYTYIWQGRAISTEKWNWTIWQTFIADSVFGLVFLLILPFVKPKQIQIE